MRRDWDYVQVQSVGAGDEEAAESNRYSRVCGRICRNSRRHPPVWRAEEAKKALPGSSFEGIRIIQLRAMWEQTQSSLSMRVKIKAVMLDLCAAHYILGNSCLFINSYSPVTLVWNPKLNLLFRCQRPLCPLESLVFVSKSNAIDNDKTKYCIQLSGSSSISCFLYLVFLVNRQICFISRIENIEFHISENSIRLKEVCRNGVSLDNINHKYI